MEEPAGDVNSNLLISASTGEPDLDVAVWRWLQWDKKMSRLSSDIWYHFVKDDKKATCNYCKNSLSIASGSTANLKRHLKTKHPLIPMHLKEEQSVRSRSPSVDNPGESTFRQSISSIGSISPASGSTTYDSFISPPTSPLALPAPRSRSTIRGFVGVTRPISMPKKRLLDKQLLKMVCAEYHPFSLVEDNGFKKFVEMLNPGYTLPSRKTLSDSLLPSAFNNILEKVKEMVNAAQAVCVTCDGWTNINNVRYYALTAHFLDDQTCMQSCLLECSEFSVRHASSNIAPWISGVLEKFSIRNKVCAVVTDNSAHIKAAIAELNLRHVSCYAHTLNLIVRAAISESIDDVVSRAKELVRYFEKSSSALAKLKEIQVFLNKDQLKLKQDVETRWNSTFDMLERLVKNKEPIVSTLALLGNIGVRNFTPEEWDIMGHAVTLLEVFNDVTKELSAEANVSLSKTTVLSRLMVRKVTETLDSIGDAPECIKFLCNRLLDGLGTQFGHRESNELISQTVLLDPRFKQQGFGDEQMFKAAYKTLIGRVKAAAQNRISATPSIQPAEASQAGTSSSSIWAEFDTAISHLRAGQDPTAEATVEVDKYLSESYLPRTHDPLKWWESRKFTYPNVYAVAVERLCIPASSVPCERLFSKAGQICIEKRSRLRSEKVTQILFVKSNMHLIESNKI